MDPCICMSVWPLSKQRIAVPRRTLFDHVNDLCAEKKKEPGDSAILYRQAKHPVMIAGRFQAIFRALAALDYDRHDILVHHLVVQANDLPGELGALAPDQSVPEVLPEVPVD